jgi:hypothetical protein
MSLEKDQESYLGRPNLFSVGLGLSRREIVSNAGERGLGLL